MRSEAYRIERWWRSAYRCFPGLVANAASGCDEALLCRDEMCFLRLARSGRALDAAPEDTLEVAARYDCTAYDARFVALAEALNVPLVTYDKKLVAVVPRAVRPPEYF